MKIIVLTFLLLLNFNLIAVSQVSYSYTTREFDMIREINKLRNNPQQYISLLSFYTDTTYFEYGNRKTLKEQMRKAQLAEGIISYLNALKKTEPMLEDSLLTQAIQMYANGEKKQNTKKFLLQNLQSNCRCMKHWQLHGSTAQEALLNLFFSKHGTIFMQVLLYPQYNSIGCYYLWDKGEEHYWFIAVTMDE